MILPDQFALKDELDFQDYRDIIFDIIKSSDTPITIGVLGQWGSGKTSLLKMIMADIERLPSASFCTAWFNAWKYNDHAALWRSLILRVLDALRPRDRNSGPLPE